VLRPARPLPPQGGSTYRPPRSTSAPAPNPYTGNFTPSRISDIAGNAAYSSDSFAQTSQTLPPLMDQYGRPIPVPVRPPTPPPPRYSDLSHMDPYYAGETDPGQHPFPGQSVARPTPDRLERFYGLRFGPDGTLIGRGNRPFETSSGNSPFGEGGRAIFVMDQHGRIFASNDVDPGEFHHSSLGGGQPVASAGELAVKNGQIEYVTASSGHYKPQMAQMYNLKLELERQGITGVPIYDHKGPYVNPPMFVTGQ
jgi:hypothetical protein